MEADPVAAFRFEAPLAALPTTALPGTPDKIAILEERASHCQALWHPLDAPNERSASRLSAVS